MRIKIVTDSTADIPPAIARDLDIKVVPIYVRFGETVYRDGVDISHKCYYDLLTTSGQHPKTSQPTPGDFAQVYREARKNADGIVSIHISAKLSGTCGSALLAKNQPGIDFPVEIIDSNFNSMGLGLTVIEAARLARDGAGMQEITKQVSNMLAHTRMLGVFNNLKYAIAGGRINKAVGSIAGILNVKPLFTFRNGEVALAGLSRTYPQAMNKLAAFVKNRGDLKAISIVHSASPEEAAALKDLLKDSPAYESIVVSELGAALGAHGGPGVLLVALIEA